VSEDDRVERIPREGGARPGERRAARAVAVHHADAPALDADDLAAPEATDDLRTVVVAGDGLDRCDSFERGHRVERRQITAMQDDLRSLGRDRS